MKGKDFFPMSPEIIESVIEEMGDGISIQDTNFKVLYQNGVHKGFIGEHTGEYCYKAYEKKENICDGCPVAMSFEDNKVHTAERVVTINDELKYFEITSSTLKDPDGNIIGAIENVRDITERRKVEEALKESEERYLLLFTNVPFGWAYHKIIVDGNNKPIDYIFLEVNDAFEKQTGLKREDSIGNKVTEVLPGIEKDPANWIGRYGEVAQTGKGIRFDNYAEPLGKWFSVTAFSPKKGYFIVVFDDITERKKAEEELKARTEELKRINKAFVGRELKMVELKKEIEELKARSGKS